MFTIPAALAIMWFVGRRRILVFSDRLFPPVLLVFPGLLRLVRAGWLRLVE